RSIPISPSQKKIIMLGTVGLSRLTVGLGISFSIVVGAFLARAQEPTNQPNLNAQSVERSAIGQLPTIQPTSTPKRQEADSQQELPNFDGGPVPQWIWGAADGEKSRLRKSFPGGAKSA